MKRATSRQDRLTQIVHAYRDAGQAWPASKQQVAQWAWRMGYWRQSPGDVIRHLARDLGHALRDELFTDPQGRRVRLNHSYVDSRVGPDGEFVQERLWDTFDQIDPPRMHMSLQNRRGHILGECRQLKSDAESFNENRGANIDLSYDFTPDLFELEQPTTYEGLDPSPE